MVVIGIIKVLFSFIGQWVQRVVPQAGLLGSLAGIGLALIGMVPLVDIFSMPIVGMISLGLIFYTLIARIKLPKNFPGVLASILIGTSLYYLLGPNRMDRRNIFWRPGHGPAFRAPHPDALDSWKDSATHGNTCRLQFPSAY